MIYMSCLTFTGGLIVMCQVQPARPDQKKEQQASSNGSAGVGSRPSQARTATLSQALAGLPESLSSLAHDMTSTLDGPTPHRANENSAREGHSTVLNLETAIVPVKKALDHAQLVSTSGVMFLQVKRHNLIKTWMKSMILI